ncbi:MAG TPA: M23 family metallopeptidase [Solirubrobacterales bacterium]|nr:M23 family metallopeptidase [Solirubrobacterales bacterium]
MALAWPGAALPQEPLPPPTEPPPPAFELTHASVKPHEAFFDARRLPRVRYAFSAPAPLDIRIELVRAGDVVASWKQPAQAPSVSQSFAWDPAQGKGPQRGRLSFRIGPEGGVTRPAGSFHLRDYEFPVRGAHSYGDRFGVPRSGGRTHEGQDVWASCGTPLVAARGGTVQAKGYSAALYGYYVTIDATGTERDLFYAHLAGPTPLGDGQRVRTGQRIGSVGKTGNAQSEGCQLHFELWPSGWHDGKPVDPLHDLRAWDGWS